MVGVVTPGMRGNGMEMESPTSQRPPSTHPSFVFLWRTLPTNQWVGVEELQVWGSGPAGCQVEGPGTLWSVVHSPAKHSSAESAKQVIENYLPTPTYLRTPNHGGEVIRSGFDKRPWIVQFDLGSSPLPPPHPLQASPLTKPAP